MSAALILEIHSSCIKQSFEKKKCIKILLSISPIFLLYDFACSTLFKLSLLVDVFGSQRSLVVASQKVLFYMNGVRATVYRSIELHKTENSTQKSIQLKQFLCI